MLVDVQNRQLPNEPLHDALTMLRETLQLLDEANAPGQIGANVDLALSQLKEFLEDEET